MSRSPDRPASPTVGGVAGWARALAALAPSGVRTGVRAIDAGDLATLREIEAETVARAVEVRRREFATGRTLLRELIGFEGAIPMRPDRAPALPPNVVGSLAHDRGLAIAAVADAGAFRALGVDVEPSDVLTGDLGRVILRPDERSIDAHLAFVLKEAAYKAWSATGGPMLDHHDVRVSIDGERFHAEVVGRGTTLAGRFRTVGGRHLALVVVPRAPGCDR